MFVCLSQSVFPRRGTGQTACALQTDDACSRVLARGPRGQTAGRQTTAAGGNTARPARRGTEGTPRRWRAGRVCEGVHPQGQGRRETEARKAR